MKNRLLKKITISIILVIFNISIIPFTLSAQGDRHPDINCEYPEDAFLHANKGGRILDVTQPPFNAVGDGVTDDTHAFVAAYDSVLAIMDTYGWDKGAPASYQTTNIIYIPDGTYLITNTIIYSGPSRYDHPNERLARIRFVGQSRDGTILKLDDNCPGYELGSNKELISFGQGDFNNGVAFNALRNMTLNTGSGNPGAVALNYCGANNSSVQNITIKSEDGEGSIGLYLRIGPNMGYHNDITIEGFDYGIYALPYHFGVNTFEYVTLKNQKKAAIRTDNSGLSIRKLLSENSVPAVALTETGAHVVIIDSELNNPSGGGMALDLRNGQLFARNVVTSGYENEILHQFLPVDLPDANYIEEYVSGEIFSLREGQTLKSLDMEIEEVPVIPWENEMDEWANVNDYGAVGDGVTNDKTAIQAAMNSGKSTIYFPNAEYYITGSVSVPASVKRINFMYGRLMGQLYVDEDASEPLLIEDGLSRGAVVLHYAPRTVILSNFSGNYKNKNSEYGAKLFINNVTNLGKSEENFVDQKVWVRYMNTEFKSGPNFTANNSEMWVLGYKVEGNTTNFKVMNGGTLEVLGGIINEWPGGSVYSPTNTPPALMNDRSNVCFIAFSNGPYTQINAIMEISESGTEYITEDMLPDRTGQYDDYFIPMYVSYEDTTSTIAVMEAENVDDFRIKYSSPTHTLWIDTEDYSDAELKIYDINGKTQMVAKPNLPIDVSYFSNGIYLIMLNGVCKKFIKY